MTKLVETILSLQNTCYSKLFIGLNKDKKYKSATPLKLNDSTSVGFKKIIAPHFFFLLLFLVFVSSVKSQQQFTLKDCIDIALKNSQQVQEVQYQKRLAAIALQQTTMQRLPNLNASLRQGQNTGRSIDPFSNQFINQTIQTGSYGLDLDMNLFSGMQLANTIKRNKANLSAAENDTEAAKNLLVLFVTRLFLQAVSNQEIIKAIRLQLSTTQEQFSNAEKRLAAGVIAESQLADLQTQIATEEINLANAINNFELVKLDLLLAMNYSESSSILFVPPSEKGLLALTELPAAATVYKAVINFFPDIKSVMLRKNAAELDKKIARSYYFPSLSLYGYVGTTYSSSVAKTLFVPDGTFTNSIATSTSNFITVNGSDYYLKESQSIKNGITKPFTYFNQLDANINAGAGISLRIPILNGLQAKFRKANATANIQRLNAQEVTVKNQLQNAIEQSIQNLRIAAERIVLTEKQIKATEQSLDFAASKMAAGTSNLLDYLLVKTNLDKAVINLIQLKYEYQLRAKIVEFYQKGSW
jgi:outer membrane protein